MTNTHYWPAASASEATALRLRRYTNLIIIIIIIIIIIQMSHYTCLRGIAPSVDSPPAVARYSKVQLQLAHYYLNNKFV